MVTIEQKLRRCCAHTQPILVNLGAELTKEYVELIRRNLISIEDIALVGFDAKAYKLSTIMMIENTPAAMLK